MKKTLLMVFYWIIAVNVYAHPGRTDARGCHTNRKTGVYHCHTPKGKVSSAPKVQVVKKQTSQKTDKSAITPTDKKQEKGQKQDQQASSKKNSGKKSTTKSPKKKKSSESTTNKLNKKQNPSSKPKEQAK